MRYTMTFLEDDYTQLTSHLFADPTIERGAYVIARPSLTEAETRLLVRHILPITADDTISASSQHMEIRAHSFVRAMKLAAQERGCFIFVHSHPTGLLGHSKQDDREEVKLFESAYTRIHQGGPHGSIVFTSPETMTGRIWLADQTTHPIERIRVLGNRFKFYMLDSDQQSPLPAFDRQVRAFGKSTQQTLKQLTVGVVGTGGT
jgi:hypothetical protein